MDAELPVRPARIADGQNCLRVSSPRAHLGSRWRDGWVRSTGSPQDFARGGKTFEEPLASLDGCYVSSIKMIIFYQGSQYIFLTNVGAGAPASLRGTIVRPYSFRRACYSNDRT